MRTPAERAPLPGAPALSLQGRALLWIGVCAAVLFVPTWVTLYHAVWQTDSQGHGPIILALAGWLVWREGRRLWDQPSPPAVAAGNVLLALAWLCYVVGRSQTVLQLEVGSHLLFVAAVMLHWRGWTGLRAIAFPLFFALFAVPLPGVFVQAVTVPLKSAVSWVAETLLYHVGYPVARQGVMLTIGQYQLLVADACAGLNSMFTLESLGLLYMKLMGHASRARNVSLAVLIIPISFISNVVRVCILVLVTYHFGDEAGQGFVHGFAGIVLFLVALGLMLAVDQVLGRCFHETRRIEA